MNIENPRWKGKNIKAFLIATLIFCDFFFRKAFTENDSQKGRLLVKLFFTPLQGLRGRWAELHIRKGLLVIFVLILSLILGIGIGPVYAQPAEDEQILINSADWIDVYSAMCYANLNGLNSKFVNSPAQGKIITSVLDRTKPVHLIQSSKDPIIAGHKDNLESEGFTVSSVTTSDSGKKLNLALADKINTTKFIIIDDSYGYNAISVAPYSIVSNSCVLFADSDNIDAVYQFLKGRTPDIIIYGRVDRAVREKLSEFNPEIIDHGDRFEDNLAIVDKYVALNQPTQIVLTNGEFIEDEIISGREPVIFLGRDVVPAEVVEYVNAHDFKTGVVIGNDLTGAATKLKDQTGMSIFIKFGQGRARGEGGFAVPEVLDMFYLPQYELSLDIVSGDYNVKTKTTEIVYQNLGKTGVFAKATIGISAGNESVTTVGDEEPFLLIPKQNSSVRMKQTSRIGQLTSCKHTFTWNTVRPVNR